MFKKGGAPSDRFTIAHFTTTVSSGTYIRSLGVDIGRAGESALGHHDVGTRRVQAAQRVAGAVAPLPGQQLADRDRHDRNAACPVSALPMDSRCISEVPS